MNSTDQNISNLDHWMSKLTLIDASYYDFEELERVMDEELFQRLCHWMRGQSCPLLDEKTMIWAHDFKDWVIQGYPINQSWPRFD